jgi:hypothetical protein
VGTQGGEALLLKCALRNWQHQHHQDILGENADLENLDFNSSMSGNYRKASELRFYFLLPPGPSITKCSVGLH